MRGAWQSAYGEGPVMQRQKEAGTAVTMTPTRHRPPRGMDPSLYWNLRRKLREQRRRRILEGTDRPGDEEGANEYLPGDDDAANEAWLDARRAQVENLARWESLVERHKIWARRKQTGATIAGVLSIFLVVPSFVLPDTPGSWVEILSWVGGFMFIFALLLWISASG